jgi:predicted nucleic acid-binding protein
VILVDTSIWVDHLRRGDAGLSALLEATDVAVHPFVVGELACGSLRRQSDVVRLLSALPQVTTATHEEVMHFIDVHRLGGRGIGYVDVHVLASASIDGIRVWTRDKALASQAASLGLAFET